MPSEHYGDYQMEIYLDGLHGKLPRFPVDHESLEAAAVEVLPSWVYSYVGYGAGDGRTQQANVDAFGRYAIVPRMLVAPTERDLSVSLFDMQLPTPLFMPPVGVVGVCSQDTHGDIAAAKASAITGVPMVASTLTQDRMEDVRPHSGDTPNLFQLYTANDKELARSFLRRAEQSGYKAVAVTLDTWITGWRPHDLNMANFPQMRGYCLQNYFTDEVFRARLSKTPEEDPGAAALEGRRSLVTPCGGRIWAGCGSRRSCRYC
jgi:lactate 2-monooxygenase